MLSLWEVNIELQLHTFKVNFCSSFFFGLKIMKSTLIDYYTEKGLHRIELQTYLHFGVRDIILHVRERLSRYWPIVILSRLHRDAICALALALGIIFISAYMRVSNLEAILILKAPSTKCVKSILEDHSLFLFLTEEAYSHSLS